MTDTRKPILAKSPARPCRGTRRADCLAPPKSQAAGVVPKRAGAPRDRVGLAAPPHYPQNPEAARQHQLRRYGTRGSANDRCRAARAAFVGPPPGLIELLSNGWIEQSNRAPKNYIDRKAPEGRPVPVGQSRLKPKADCQFDNSPPRGKDRLRPTSHVTMPDKECTSRH
jgi:hypothetical protein